MPAISLTQGKQAIVCDCHYDLVKDYVWCYAPVGYAVRRVGGRKAPLTFMHRVIASALDGLQVDHKNHNKLDNSCFNLRVCTKSENSYNRSHQSNSKSRVKGVSWDKFGNRWHVQITKDGKRVFSAYSKDDLAAAAKIYNEKAKELFGEFAYLNPRSAV